ncbi:hypothetical protein BCR34DRAFT_604246 [Clohesyomyces aquaticus]|uniref:Six-hairpin glycosidase-like protein n=1 Tax=Clohesyomyces aquaticus TaxID=1231657 RepID=A0A1Y1Z814_9PLEO|nr:hypothetical protein BCR34DRAFT_604246 [Clohesyomyces aquaticus]
MAYFRAGKTRRLAWSVFLLLEIFTASVSALYRGDSPSSGFNSGHGSESQHVLRPIRPIQQPYEPIPSTPDSRPENGEPLISPYAITNPLQELHSALSTMQNFYFSLWLGKWTTAIDWTAAVMGTHVSAALYSLSHSLPYTMPGTFDKDRKIDVEAQMIENEINKYFGHVITYYFGEDHFAIRNQAYDDMLWVVLGWLESIQFINGHSDMHYPASPDRAAGESDWHGKQFAPAFAHRARVFYDLASKGWDWKLCGGGMNWNPHTRLPYKNAITNELFISASIGMYLQFPGDTNCSPFMSGHDRGENLDWKLLRNQELGASDSCSSDSRKATYDPIYLSAAVNAYDWLKNSGMKNDQGLYVDGFHIMDYGKNGSIGTGKCDERNEMVYTYNQGVILSGLRGLWEGTGRVEYLEDGHELIRDVIRATGWTDTDIAPTVAFSKARNSNPGHKQRQAQPKQPSPWSGIGSSGVLTEICDPYGTCSQNGQTFKGIFFHHLTIFCAKLPTSAAMPGKTFFADKTISALHRRGCNDYAPWVLHNANAALKTRDTRGRFGTWWGVNAGTNADDLSENPLRKTLLRKGITAIFPENATDYRNDPQTLFHDTESEWDSDIDPETHVGGMKGRETSDPNRDLNDRGRGRTVETQGGGVAVVRAMWEFLRNYDDDDA